MAIDNPERRPGIGRVIFVALLLGAAGVLWYMFMWPKIEPEYTAMEPDYMPGSRVLVNKRAAQFAKGDVVYYAYDYMEEHHEQIGKIAGAPGDKIVLEPANRRIWDQTKDREAGPGGELLGAIPEGKYYIVDNETKGEWADSRDFGLVGRLAIKGKVIRTLPF